MTTGRRALTRSERALLFVLAVLALGLGVEAGVRRFYLEPRDRLVGEIEQAQSGLERMQRLGARAAEIRLAYEELMRSEGDEPRPELSTPDLLLEIEKLARESVRLHSVQPRSAPAEGGGDLRLSIEASSDLAGLGRFLQRTTSELGLRVTALTLTADAAGEGAARVRSRIELDVVSHGG